MLKGKVILILLELMFFIDILFEWVVVDLVGFIFLVIDCGNRYIFIMVDYSIWYLEVIVLKGIEIECVVEVLFEFFIRLGIFKEILLDMGI